jgi:hypothetical protein
MRWHRHFGLGLSKTRGPLLGASRVILGTPQRSALVNLFRGNVIRDVSNALPEEIDLLVYA